MQKMDKNKILRENLAKGVVKFSFEKKDGSIREAVGTTNPEFFTSSYTPKGGYGPSEFGYKSYWDLEANGWRCYNPDKLLSAPGLF